MPRRDWLWAVLPPFCIVSAFVSPHFQITTLPAISVNLLIIAALSFHWSMPHLLITPTQSSVLSPHSFSLSPHSLFPLLSLTKPLLTALVLGTTLAGYYLGSHGHLNFSACISTLIGTALVAAGSLAINEHDERDLDSKLSRTARRPIPSGKIAPGVALRFGVALSIAGLAWLSLAAGPIPALLAANALAIYVFIYTPLKRVTPLATLVGAVSGALPPLIGWSAAGPLTPAAWRLFLILFLWQIPHFLAIGWRWRSDYANAGVPVYCALDRTGRSTGLHMLNYSAAVVIVSLLGPKSALDLIGTSILGLLLMLPCIAFALRPGRFTARHVFLATVIYIPLLLLLSALGWIWNDP